MKKHYILLFPTLLFVVALQGTDYVHISEIMYDTPLNEVITAPPYSNGEYIELYNAGYESVNLNGWRLKGDGSTENLSLGNLSLPAQSSLIVAYRHSWTSSFQLSEVFPAVSDYSGTIIYQNTITLKNTKEYIRLYDASGLLRDSVYYGNETSIKPISARLITENADGTAGSECLSVQRVTVDFSGNGVATANHLHWVVDKVSPLLPHENYTGLGVYLNARVKYAYDAGGNRISRTIVLNQQQGVKRQTTDSISYSDMLANKEIKLYPNPVRTNLTVSVSGYDTDIAGEYLLFDNQGKMILHDRINAGSFQIDMSPYATGNYIIRIAINGEATTWKIIKQ